MSAKHAVISCEASDAETPDAYVITITDFSRHGVFVNGERITPGEPTSLKHDDDVVFPFSLEYKFVVFPNGAPRPVPPPTAGNAVKKTPGSKKKSVACKFGGAKRGASAHEQDDDTEVTAKRAKACDDAREIGGVALSFDDDAEIGSVDKGKGKGNMDSVDTHAARADTNDAIEAAKRLETVNTSLRATLVGVEKEREHFKGLLSVHKALLENEKTARDAIVARAAETAREALAVAETRATVAEAAKEKASHELKAAICSRNKSIAAIKRANAAREGAEERERLASVAHLEHTTALEHENATHRANLDEARALASDAQQETRLVREDLARAHQILEAFAAEKSALANSLDQAVRRADVADTCAAPLRAEAAEALARCKKGEDAAMAMADRLAVARVAHAQAMAALIEVGARLGGGVSPDVAEKENGLTAEDPTGGWIDATLPSELPAIAETERPFDTEPTTTEGGETEHQNAFPEGETERQHVGMDIMYATEPQTEVPVSHDGDGDRRSEDPVPETELAFPGPGNDAETETPRDGAVDDMLPPPARLTASPFAGKFRTLRDSDTRDPESDIEEEEVPAAAAAAAAPSAATPEKPGVHTQEAASVLGGDLNEHRSGSHRRGSTVSAVLAGVIDECVDDGAAPAEDELVVIADDTDEEAAEEEEASAEEEEASAEEEEEAAEEEEASEEEESASDDDDFQVEENRPAKVSPSGKENARTAPKKFGVDDLTGSGIGDPVPMSFLSS